MSATIDTLSDTIRELRAAGRKRARVGEWYVTIGETYATFEHEDDRAARLAKTDDGA